MPFLAWGQNSNLSSSDSLKVLPTKYQVKALFYRIEENGQRLLTDTNIELYNRKGQLLTDSTITFANYSHNMLDDVYTVSKYTYNTNNQLVKWKKVKSGLSNLGRCSIETTEIYTYPSRRRQLLTGRNITRCRGRVLENTTYTELTKFNNNGLIYEVINSDKDGKISRTYEYEGNKLKRTISIDENDGTVLMVTLYDNDIHRDSLIIQRKERRDSDGELTKVSEYAEHTLTQRWAYSLEERTGSHIDGAHYEKFVPKEFDENGKCILTEVFNSDNKLVRVIVYEIVYY